MRNHVLLVFGLMILAAVACKKNKDGDTAKSPFELIAGTTWKTDTIGIDTNGDGAIDQALPFPLDACDKDNTLSFSSDSTGISSEGSLKCDESDPDTQPLVWYLKDNNKVINISGLSEGELNGDVNIVTLTEATFVLSKPYNIPIPGFPAGSLIVALKK